jgi:hypothetical protein
MKADLIIGVDHGRRRLGSETRPTIAAAVVTYRPAHKHAGTQRPLFAMSGVRAVDLALATLDERPGRPINLPGAPAGTSYLGLPTRRSAAGPVIIYRPMLPSEGEGWLVVSLLSPAEYRNIGRAEELVTASPAAREIVNAVVAGTVATAGAATATGAAPSPTVFSTQQTGGSVATTGSVVSACPHSASALVSSAW